jgi:uroporphyrinogen decarboxylase
MNKIERVDAVIQGRLPDRPPVSFWYHFGPENESGPEAVAAHVRHVETYDVDFLKVMCDARYPLDPPIDVLPAANPDVPPGQGLDYLAVLRGDEGPMGRHLEVLRQLASRYAGQMRLSTTIFNSWSTLRRLMGSDIDVHGPPTRQRVADTRDAAMNRWLREDPASLARALNIIAESLARFAAKCLEAGADGIYLSVRDDWVDTPENGPGIYDRFVKHNDLAILSAASAGTLNIVHVCGKAIDFRRFTNYPTDVIHWADRTSGPAISEVVGTVRPAICCGIDNLGTLISGTPEQCAEEVASALDEGGGRPIMIAPGCTFNANRVPPENLHAIRRAVDEVPTYSSRSA